MKDFFTWDEIMRDLAIVVAVALFVFVSANITPITLETVSSGEASSSLFDFLKNKVAVETVVNFFVSLRPVFAVAAVVFLAGIFFSIIKAREVHHKEHEKYAPIPVEEITAKEKMVQWQVVLDHVNSESPAEWKLAILEADNMLDEILEDQGYFGETVAEKLQAMDPTRIASYSEVWEAHKLRNQIAHGGALDMELSKKLARDTVAKFGNAFRDLGYI